MDFFILNPQDINVEDLKRRWMPWMFDEDEIVDANNWIWLVGEMNQAFDFIVHRYVQGEVTDRQAEVFLIIVEQIITENPERNNYNMIFEIYSTVYGNNPDNLFINMVENAVNGDEIDYLVSVFVEAYMNDSPDKYRLSFDVNYIPHITHKYQVVGEA